MHCVLCRFHYVYTSLRYNPAAPPLCVRGQLRSLNHKLCRLGMSERLIFDFIRTL